MSSTAPLTPETHASRAARHAKVGRALRDVGDEWATVCFFYSAYHLVRCAILRDPIFDDPARLTALNRDLLPDDRYVSRHKGRKNRFEKEWGLNELVLVLYRHVAGPYDLLHQASITVRYGSGLPAGWLDRSSDQLDQIVAAHDSGSLVAPGA